MRMGSKGQLAFAIVALITLVVGIYLVDELTYPWCNCVDADDINMTLFYEVENNTYPCDGVKCDTDYSVWCNGTELNVTAGEYTIDGCNVTLENQTWNNTNCMLEYTHEGDNYHGTDATAQVVCNIPVIALLLGFILAGGYAFFKGAA